MAVNAKAVVDIEVNDKQFKDFQGAFEKYMRVLGRMPGAWTAMSKEQKAMVQSIQQGTAALMAQNEVMRKNSAHAKDVAVHSEKAAFSWHNIREHGKKFSEFIFSAHERMMKWGGILAGIMTGMGAASSWGLYGLGQWVRGGSIASSKVGMRTGELRAVKGVFGDPYGIDVEGIAKTVTTAQGNKGSDEYAALAGILGLNPDQLKGTQKVTAVLDALRTKMKGGWTPEMLEQMTGGKFSAGDMHALNNISEDDYQKGKHEVPESAQKLDLDPSRVAKWNEFLKKIDEATEQLKTILANSLTPLLDIFTKNSARWMEQFNKFMHDPATQKFIEDLPGELERATVSLIESIKSLSDWIDRRFNQNKYAAEELKKHNERLAKAQEEMKKDFGFSGSDIYTVDELLNKFRGLFKPPDPNYVDPRNPYATKPQGSYQDGTPMVPKTGTYTLHRGEMVLPEADADLLRHSSMDDWKRAISGIEGGYGSVNKFTGASGKYQVMPGNVPSWTREALGYSMTVEDFRKSPAAQERVFEHIFGQYVRQFGNPVDAASAWFSGQPFSGNRAGPDAMGTSVPGYVRQFIAGLGASGIMSASTSGRTSVDINDNTGGNVAMALTQMATVGIPLHPV